MPYTQHTRVTISGVCSGVNTVTTLRFMESANTTAEKSALAIAVRDRWLAQWKNGMAAAMNFIGIEVRVIGQSSDVPYNLPINVVGGGSALAPQQLAIQYNLYSGQAGRSGRGRLFAPGLHTGAFSGGKLSTAVTNSLEVDLATLKGRWMAGGTEAYHLGIASRKNTAMYACVEMTYNQIVSTLRTRRLGVGI